MDNSRLSRINPRGNALKIAIIYAIVSVIWIITSDQVLALTVTNTNFLAIVASIKGIMFVTITTLLIYFLVYRNLNSIKESEDRFLKAFSTNPVAIVLTTPNGNIIDVNERYLELSGFKKKELYGKTAMDLKITNKKTENNIIAEFNENGEVKDFESVITTRTGAKRTVLITIESINIAGKKRHLNYLYDITEREKVKEMLVDSEEKYREIFNNAYDMISLVSITPEGLPGNFLEVNDVVIKRLGYNKEELLNMGPMDIVDPSESEEFLNNIKIIKSKKQHEFSTYHITKDGKRIPVEVSVHVFNLRGENVVLAIVRDITERKKSEEELEHSLHEKEALLREVHHRVKNNLQIISSLLSLQSDLVENEFRDILMTSQSRIKSMAMIHEKLYKSSDLTHIHIKSYIENFISDLILLYGVNTSLIKTHIEVDDLQIGLDTAIPLGLIINELLINIFKHAFPTGQKGNIFVNLNSEGDLYILKISDDGIGLPENVSPENIESLGLQLVSNLVNQLDGTMSISRDNGTTFQILFKELKYRKRV